MAIQTFTKLYEGIIPLRRAGQVIYWRWPISGTLKFIRLVGAETSSFFGTWYFNVRNDGANVLPSDNPNMLKFTNADRDDEKTGLSTSVIAAKSGSLFLVNPGSGQLFQPITIIMGIDDGIEPAEEDVQVTTASIANGATANLTAPLGKSYEVHKIVANRACRVRGYLNAAYRTADAARPVGTDPDNSTEHGVVFDVVLTGGNLTWDLAPIAVGSDREASRLGNIAIAVENNSGSTNTVTVTFTTLKKEV